MHTAPRRIWLCADDYGMSPGVNAGIRELIARGRINATSVMMAARNIAEDEASPLELLNSGQKRAAIGLHVTLTAPFRPMSGGFTPLRNGSFLSFGRLFGAALPLRLDHERLVVEIAAQLRAFLDTFGHPPDFIDGHQHVHLFPQVRSAFLKVAAEAAPNAWVRQCGRAQSLWRLHDRKALTLDVLSLGFRSRAERLGLATNPAFAGAYNFKAKPDFAKIFPRFLAGLPDGGLIMCHPGFVDDELKSIDALTDMREREFEYFNSDDFPQLLARHGVALAQPDSEAA